MSKAIAITACSRDLLRFSSLGPKSIVADFSGGRLITDAGALLLREARRGSGKCD